MDDFNVGILCLALLCSMAWVAVLQTKISGLKDENKKLRLALKLGIKQTVSDVHVTESVPRYIRGKKA